ncbi:MAG: amidohydrolase family protein [Candidatus Kariarchaeaceae archaeon]
MDIAIINSTLLTFEGKNLGIIDNGGIGIHGSKISYVGPTDGFDYKSADKIIDGKNQVTMPGLINAHVHSGSTILRGTAQDVPEIEWMNKAMGPFSKHLSSDNRILGSKLGVLEGVQTGTTTFAEYAGNVSELVEQVYLPYQVRVIATETINEVSSNRSHLQPTDLYEFDKGKGEEGIKRANELFKTFSHHPLVTSMYGPQALDMISLDLLSNIHDLTTDQDSKVHMHVAQGGRERLQISGRYGTGSTTVSVLNEHNLLNENLIAAHIHDTNANERTLMVQKKVKLVSCQSSIAMIDGIVPPLNHYLSIGGLAGLGTDQAPGPGNHNMFREMRTASLLAKVLHKDPTSLPAWRALQLTTIGGATVLGLDDKIGSLKVGKEADIITISLDHLNLLPVASNPFHTIIPNLVYSANGREVENVIINGKLVYEERKFLNVDEHKIKQEVNFQANRILNSAEEDWRAAGSSLVDKVDEGWM